MAKVIVSISMSLDGFIAGANISSKQPMGENGERLHEWLFSKSKTENDSKVIEETVESSGAVIVGGLTYKVGIDDGWGGVSPFKVPAFVLTHNIPNKKVEGFTYITTGVESILMEATKQAADKNIWLLGGANIIQQFMRLKLVDELQINLVDILLQKGTRLFEAVGPTELETLRVLESAGVTHIKYRIVK